jgi:hypothetical protein
MSNNKQSSVEWLWLNLTDDLIGDLPPEKIHRIYELVQQAKAMHKSEIIWAHGIKMKGVNNHKCVSGEQYYNETFGGNNEQ